MKKEKMFLIYEPEALQFDDGDFMSIPRIVFANSESEAMEKFADKYYIALFNFDEKAFIFEHVFSDYLEEHGRMDDITDEEYGEVISDYFDGNKEFIDIYNKYTNTDDIEEAMEHITREFAIFYATKEDCFEWFKVKEVTEDMVTR